MGELSLQLRGAMASESALWIEGKAAQGKIARLEAEIQRLQSAKRLAGPEAGPEAGEVRCSRSACEANGTVGFRGGEAGFSTSTHRELARALAADQVEQKHLKGSIDDHTSHVETLSGELAAQKTETMEKDKEAVDLREQLERMREESDSASRQAERESERVASMQTELKAANERLEERKRGMNELQTRSTAMQKEALVEQAKAHEALTAAHSQLDAAQVRINCLQHEITFATEALQHAKNEITENHRHHSGLESTLANVNGALVQRSHELIQTEAVSLRLKETKDRAYKDADAENERAHSKEQQVLSARREVADLREQAQRMQERIDALELNVKRLSRNRKRRRLFYWRERRRGTRK